MTKNKIGIINFHIGAFGGASKRYTNLFLYLNQENPGRFYYIINRELYDHIINIFPNTTLTNILVVGESQNKFGTRMIKKSQQIEQSVTDHQFIIDHQFIRDRLLLEKRISFFRKFYRYVKNYYRQYRLFKEIEVIRSKFAIKTFMGVFGGILPLYFYFKRANRPAIIFSDMDSWFYEIHPEDKKYWYRKYFSFNFALRNSDRIDFLSPFIYEGVKKIGIPINDKLISITPSSFADYSSCSVGNKQKFEISFAGRLENNKNPMLYLEAARITLKKFPDIKFHLLGDGKLKNQIEKYLSLYNLNGKVNFQFHLNPPDIFSQTSVFVSLQSTNNYPSQSILEAMACGNAIIATDVGDTRMFINETNGLLIKSDLDALVKAIEYMITNKKKTEELGMNAQKYVLENHTIDKHAEYYTRLFNVAYNERMSQQ